MNSFHIFITLLAITTTGTFAANSCSRTVILGLQSPEKSTIAVKRTASGKAVTFHGSKTTQIPIKATDVHYVSFSPASKTLQLFFGKDNGCSMSVSLAIEAPKNYHWELTTIKGSKPCEENGNACVIETGVLCSPSPNFRVKLGGKVKSTLVLNLRKGKYSEC